MIFAIDRAGLVGEDGPTHHGAFDLSYLRQIPNLTIMAPKDGSELKNLLFSLFEWEEGPLAIRYPRVNIPDEFNSEIEKIEKGKWEIIQKGKDVLILAVGSMVYPAIESALELIEDDIYCTVVNCRFVKPLDTVMLSELLSQNDRVLTIEENVLAGGFGSSILEFIEQNEIGNLKMKRLGIPDKFIEHGSRKQLLDKLSLNSEGIQKAVRNLLTKKESKINSSKNE